MPKRGDLTTRYGQVWGGGKEEGWGLGRGNTEKTGFFWYLDPYLQKGNCSIRFIVMGMSRGVFSGFSDRILYIMIIVAR